MRTGTGWFSPCAACVAARPLIRSATMSRLLLAFSCFFRVLFGKKLPPAAIALLPATTAAEPTRDPVAKPREKAGPRDAGAPGESGASRESRQPRESTDGKERVGKEASAREARAEADKPRVSTAQHHRDGALALLALLQREGRLVDFLREALDGFSDADIGAAARDVHRGCRKVLDQHLSLEPVMPGAEEARVAVPKGFDPAEIRLIGEAKGEPPFAGTLRHHGWRVVDARLPALTDGVDRTVIAPAEVEL